MLLFYVASDKILTKQLGWANYHYLSAQQNGWMFKR